MTEPTTDPRFQRFTSLADLTPVDFRRAAVLLGAWIDDDTDPLPIEQVFAEVADDSRITPLISCILAVASWATPDFCSQKTRDNLANMALQFAAEEATEATT